MKYLNTKTGKVVTRNVYNHLKIIQDVNLYKLVSVSTELISFVIKFLRKDKKVPTNIIIGGVTGWLQIEFFNGGVTAGYKRFHSDYAGNFRYFVVKGNTEKESREKLYELLKGKGLIG